MDFVKKCKRVLVSSKRKLQADEDSSSSISYGKLLLSEKQRRQKKKEKPPHHQVAPQGCLAVYVGAERQRFVIKIKHANHPLFKMLLEAAENEYGYRNDGPLWLPCDVDLFCEALGEIQSHEEVDDDMGYVGCTFHKGQSSRQSSSSVAHSPLSCRSNFSYADYYELLV
ncbi:hypothetical protein RIF29_06763 [Crotalaria pallida]|uniref:Uncharacterized protein n=1 Tax=Crotalaria pallida TaxID=3830 RepID=A0AAN9J3I3_CROPI